MVFAAIWLLVLLRGVYEPPPPKTRNQNKDIETKAGTETRTDQTLRKVEPLKKITAKEYRERGDKEFEIKKGDLRVYIIKEDGHIVVLGGKKGAQDEDIRKFRSIKERYLNSKKTTL